MKLNLGAGNQRLKAGYITLDNNPAMNPDILATVPPIPLADESVEAVYASHFVEHLTDTDAIALMREIWRVLILGGKVEIIVPYAFSHGAIQDPTHKSQWVPEKFTYFLPVTRHLGYGFEDRFEVVKLCIDSHPESGQNVIAILKKVLE